MGLKDYLKKIKIKNLQEKLYGLSMYINLKTMVLTSGEPFHRILVNELLKMC